MLNVNFYSEREPYADVMDKLLYFAMAGGRPIDMHDEPEFWSEEEKAFRLNPFAFNETNTVFFVRTESPFSQWHPSVFTLDENTFVTAEQYMMFMKAMYFHDTEIAVQILGTTDPKEQKALGRQVKGFDVNEWNSVCRKIVYDGNVAKFAQNEHLKEAMFATGNKWLVEAAHYDPIWGIGLRDSDPLAHDIRTWKGVNWLGFTLMAVRI
jgi:ribA/ribD-fused uncharacterized protein